MLLILFAEIIGNIEGVAGDKISIPCNITATTPNDAVSLILWYKDDSTVPIYRYVISFSYFYVKTYRRFETTHEFAVFGLD